LTPRSSVTSPRGGQTDTEESAEVRTNTTLTWPIRAVGRSLAAAAAILLLFSVATGHAAGPGQGAAARRAAPHASATSAPTLGVSSIVPNGAGFGRVRPRTISYGGDPTSFVSHIRWHSWGGGRATGTGAADWVWPGWCVACGSVGLTATVVAFGRTICDGHPAYSHVEWFFPSRGMSFDPRLSEENVCSGRLGSSPSLKERRCGQVALGSGGATGDRATAITMYGSPISCATARRFVSGSGAARFAGHNARFHLGGWWCGSELSMDLGGLQSFSCERGDFTNVSFDLKTAGG
jgi:hypothetical protein